MYIIHGTPASVISDNRKIPFFKSKDYELNIFILCLKEDKKTLFSNHIRYMVLKPSAPANIAFSFNCIYLKCMKQIERFFPSKPFDAWKVQIFLLLFSRFISINVNLTLIFHTSLVSLVGFSSLFILFFIELKSHNFLRFCLLRTSSRLLGVHIECHK